MKIVIQVVLAVAIIVLGYLLWESINKPIRFNKEKDRIDEAKIIIGLEDYDTIARQTAISKDTIRIRVARLLDAFNMYYENLS